MSRVVTELPEADQAGQRDHWELSDGVVVEGTFLGVGSSRRIEHDHVGDRVGPSDYCGRCRWMEIRIFAASDRYVISYTRASEVPGEQDDYRVASVDTASDLVRALIQPPKRSKPAHLALRQAAELDATIAELYS